MLKSIIYIFIGGGLGSVLRFGMSNWVSKLIPHYFPYATLAVNVIACLVLGFSIGFIDQRQLTSASTKLFWTVGFCGGFSTFSTFSNETLVMLQSGFTLSALCYVVLSLVLCLSATFGGMYVGENF